MCVSLFFCWMCRSVPSVRGVIRIPPGQRLHTQSSFCLYIIYSSLSWSYIFSTQSQQLTGELCIMFYLGIEENFCTEYHCWPCSCFININESDWISGVWTLHFTEHCWSQDLSFVFLDPPPGADGDVDAAAHHITAMFSSCNSSPDKPVYHHYTTATDTCNVQVVFHLVIDQVMKANLADVQML